MKNQTINIIREELNKFDVQPLKILLFGSRARGDNNHDSDWDFFVIVDKNITRDEKWSIIINIKRRLAKLKVPNDIIINSSEQVLSRQKDVGQIAYYAVKEGIPYE